MQFQLFLADLEGKNFYPKFSGSKLWGIPEIRGKNHRPNINFQKFIVPAVKIAKLKRHRLL